MASMSESPRPEAHKRCIMYLTGQHNVIPQDEETMAGITHIIIAFYSSSLFNVEKTPPEFPLFTTVEKVRRAAHAKTRVMVAIGGWGDSLGFEEAARDDESRSRWARQVAAMVDQQGADGVDIDWEFPGGNRDDYKLVPNSEREWEIEAFVYLIEQLRKTLGSSKIISLAVPGGASDLIAFTNTTTRRIARQVDFFNVMTYDMMGRRSTVVAHHSGIADSKDAIKRYIDRGVPPCMINLGLGYYVKWCMTQECRVENPLGCQTQLLEDPTTGADLGKTGGFSWHDETPPELRHSFQLSLECGKYFDDGSYGYWDAAQKRWWSYDTPKTILRKLDAFFAEPSLGLGGVFAWGLGEDAPRFEHLGATLAGLARLQRGSRACGDDQDVRTCATS
ncbi:hypothetical protein CDD81_8041 [Ophiocordyceps australis]|uniref:chitinase n=1 Tax=Ophiocordyceps australis TaxID=1399860 RepID=A0A2C5Y1Z6_9HYPO|nr:hypothetical protein CDD81_8041 [Ophiocordyceps australis]